MFWVIVMFLALCWLPWRSLWEACHLTGRHSGTPGRPCERRSGTHMDARGVPKREEPSWAGLLALIMGAHLPSWPGRAMGWVWSSASISPHSDTSVFVRSDISPPCRLGTGVTVGLCFLLPPASVEVGEANSSSLACWWGAWDSQVQGPWPAP